MVVLLTSINGRGHIDGFVKTYDRSYGRDLHEMTYYDLVRRGAIPRGAYIFGDAWRMNPLQRQMVRLIANVLRAEGDSVRIFNDPDRQLGRFELMRRLCEAGRNSFNVHRIEDIERARFPVFLRADNDHLGPRTGLLQTPDEVKRESSRLVLDGVPTQRQMAIEYIETGNEQGLYRKYAALRIGETILAHHMMLCNSWTSKRATRLRTPEERDESDEYTLSNPHAELLMPIFEIAGIEYGRIDYGLKDGRIETWEINDNPIYMHLTQRNQMSRVVKHPSIKAALDRLSCGIPEGPPIELALPPDAILGVHS